MNEFRSTVNQEAGSLTAFVAVFMVALFAVGGLVVDGGRYLAARQACQSEAEQAARAGADAIDTGMLRQGVVSVDPSGGVNAAESYMAIAGHPGSAAVSGSSVTASVDAYPLQTTLLGIIGISHFEVDASATANAIHGVTAGS